MMVSVVEIMKLEWSMERRSGVDLKYVVIPYTPLRVDFNRDPIA